MAPALPVLIDTDPAIGLPGRDVDDALALLQACRHPALDVRGVTTVFGNADIADTDQRAREVLDVGGHTAVPVARGAGSAAEIAAPSEAADLLIDRLTAGPHTVLALGPLTNIATALLRAPEIAGNVRELIFVGGRRPGVEFLIGTATTSLMDLNFELDARAAQIVLDQAFPLAYAGFEVSTCVRLGPADVATLAAADTPVARYLGPPVEAWLHHWERAFGVAYFHPWDAVAVGYLTDPELYTREALKTAIVDGPDRPYLHAVPAGPARAVTFCSAVEGEPFRERLLTLLD